MTSLYRWHTIQRWGPQPDKMAKSKGLSPERADAAREFIRALIDRDFGGIAWPFAKALNVSQASISSFLASKAGIGLNVLEKVADYANASLDEVVGRGGMPQARDLDRLERMLLERLADIRLRKTRRSPSGFPPPAHPSSIPPGTPNVFAMHGQSRHPRKK